MEIITVVATLNKFAYWSTQGIKTLFKFNGGQLQNLADTSRGAQIINVSFGEKVLCLGKVHRAKVTNEKLKIEATLAFSNEEFLKIYLPIYLVPEFSQPEFKIINFILTHNPSDKTLLPISAKYQMLEYNQLINQLKVIRPDLSEVVIAREIKNCSFLNCTPVKNILQNCISLCRQNKPLPWEFGH